MSEHEHEQDVQMDEDIDMHASSHAGEPTPDHPEEHTLEASEENAPIERKKQKQKAADPLAREPGKSLFPISRVQRVLKADKELPIVSREAVLLISLATEEFVKRISEASHRLAVREGRTTVQRKDLASVCRRADEFLFLEELIPLYEPETAARRKPKALQPKDDDSRPTTFLDQYVSRTKDAQDTPDGDAAAYEEEHAGGMEDITMHEDGTMTG